MLEGNAKVSGRGQKVFTMRQHASVVRGVIVSVCLSQVSVLLKQLNIGSCKQRHMIAQELLVF